MQIVKMYSKTIVSTALISSFLISSSFLSGCATQSLAKNTTRVTTKQIKNILSEDRVIGFGKPNGSIPNIPAYSMVVIGEKNSYVITTGSSQFLTLMSKLDSKNIKFTKQIAFLSEKNDGSFNGKLPLTYLKHQEDVSKADQVFFIENGARNCTSRDDKKMQAVRYCFDIPMEGYVYPQARNIAQLQANFTQLNHAYKVQIYNVTTKTEKQMRNSPAETLLLAPFAIAFDIVSLPFLAIDKIFED